MNWTTDKLAELGRLLKCRLTAGQIGTELGITRNAVIGKARRMGMSLESPQTEIRRSQKPKHFPPRPRKFNQDRSTKHKLRKPTEPYLKPLPLPEQFVRDFMVPTHRPESTAEAIVALRGITGSGQCRMPLGDPAKPGFHFCNCDGIPGKPYCAEHNAIANQPRKER